MKSLLTFFLQTKAGASIPDGAMAARVPSKHKAVGSSPTSGTQDFFLVVGLGERFFPGITVHTQIYRHPILPTAPIDFLRKGWR